MRDWETDSGGIAAFAPLSAERGPKLIPLVDLLKREIKRDSLIKGILPSASLASLFGETGSGKTFLAIDMAMAIATNTDWYGHKVKPGNVIYVSAEDPAGVQMRLAAYAMVQPEANTAAIDVVEEALPLTDIGACQGLINVVFEKHQHSTRLVVIDTSDACFGGADDSTNVGMRAYVDAVKHIRNKLGCTVLSVMHPGHGNVDRERGGSNFKAAMDVRLQLVAQGENQHVLSNPKQKNDMEHPPMVFERRVVDLALDEDDEPITSCVLHYKPDAAVQNTSKKNSMPPSARTLADALDAAVKAKGRPASEMFSMDVIEAETTLTPFTQVAEIEDWREEARRRGDADTSAATFRQSFKRSRDRLKADKWIMELDGYAYRVSRNKS